MTTYGPLFRRKIHIRRQGEHSAAGWLEDDFHHFGVALDARDGVITDARMASPRTPYSTCVGAGDPLRDLIGKPLFARASDVGALVNTRRQCTHVIELAALVAPYLARDAREPLDYEIVIPDREILPYVPGLRRRHGTGVAELFANGEPALSWSLDDETITGPAPFEGWPVLEGFRQRTDALPAELADQAMALRRGIFVSRARGVATRDLGRHPNSRVAVCFTHQPDQHHAHKKQLPSRMSFEDGTGMLALADTPL